jgi:signal peptidase I
MRHALRFLMPLAIALVLAAIVRSAFVRIYAIPSASMQPTLQVGDHIIVTPFARDARPQRGDVIVFRSPFDDELMVKRVIAEPGDLVASINGRVILRGHAVAEPYALAPTHGISPQIVPADSYFVLGDNRTNSYDSRLWGTLPRSLVIGRARMVLWSSGHGDSAPHANAKTVKPSALHLPALRLDRLFKRIE